MSRISEFDMKIHILRVFDRENRSQNVFNIIGRQYQKGPLEALLFPNDTFTAQERAFAMQCIVELKETGLIVPTYSDISAPEDWMIITENGKAALRDGILDDLDTALKTLSSEFPLMRKGAWSAANSNSSDALRQAAHSGRELLNQVLATLSPEELVKEQPWFNSERVTRRDRYKYAIQIRGRGKSDNDLEIAQKATELMELIYKKLSAAAHDRKPIDRVTVKDALSTNDIVLRILLL